VARSDPRRALLIALGAVVAAAALVFLAVALGSEGRQSTPYGPDDPEFVVGDAEDRVDDVPLVFPDVAEGDRPIIVHHVGDDHGEGWVAFDAAPGGCVVEYVPAEDEFADCEGERYPPTGEGLPAYDVRVDEDGDVVVDLNPDD
jgi:hypothetical protein